MIQDFKTNLFKSEHHLSLSRCWCLVLIKLLAISLAPPFVFWHLERVFLFVIQLLVPSPRASELATALIAGTAI